MFEAKNTKKLNKKLLVPFITAGIKGWEETLLAFQDEGADAVEVGIPFSDAVMDGPVICEANRRALELGITPNIILEKVSQLNLSVPIIAMTYCNIAYRVGLNQFAGSLASSGFSGAILADMNYEVSGEWIEAGKDANISTIFLAAPTASDERLKNIAEVSTGFIYAVGLLGVTGERKELASSTIEILKRLKRITEMPVLAGVGISTPKQAAEACEVADGVIVGSALVRVLLEEEKPKKVAKLLAGFRSVI